MFGKKNLGEIVKVFTKVRDELQQFVEATGQEVKSTNMQMAEMRVANHDRQVEIMSAAAMRDNIDKMMATDKKEDK